MLNAIIAPCLLRVSEDWFQPNTTEAPAIGENTLLILLANYEAQSSTKPHRDFNIALDLDPTLALLLRVPVAAHTHTDSVQVQKNGDDIRSDLNIHVPVRERSRVERFSGGEHEFRWRGMLAVVEGDDENDTVLALGDARAEHAQAHIVGFDALVHRALFRPAVTV